MSSIDTTWQEISTSAFLGTLRKHFQLTSAAGSLSSVLQAASQDAADERLLLRAAAIAALYRRAGQLPPQGQLSLVPASPLDQQPRSSRLCGDLLEQILASGRVPLLVEWAKLAAQRGVRVREELLPVLLGQQKAILPLRSHLLPVLGERGCWLAAQNPDWKAFARAEDLSAWHDGQRKERLAFLNDLRARDPQAARELLAGGWPQETPADRAAFLPVLSVGISIEDEPFLESCLSDRRKEVRQAAAGLLARLPGSRLVQRMTARAQNMLRFRQGLLRSSIDVFIDDHPDENFTRDGLEETPPASLPFGAKGWWLAQVLASTPPQTWTSLWGKRPASLLEMVRKHEWEDALLYGWSEAALRFQDGEWIDELFDYETRRGDPGRIYELFVRLPAEKKDPHMTALLRDNPSLSYEQPSSIWLSACQYIWNNELTQQVTTCICWTLQREDMPPWRWESLLREIGVYFHPAELAGSIQRITAAQEKRIKNDPYAGSLLAVLRFRLEMHRAFDEVNR
jgi:hypothetical protein